jgi:hypothetical protein
MDQVCGYCRRLGFHLEIQGEFLDPKNSADGSKLVHFGELCCCKGTVDGISNYNLPADLERLYTSSDPDAVLFQNNARTFNNRMSMSLLTAQHG